MYNKYFLNIQYVSGLVVLLIFHENIICSDSKTFFFLHVYIFSYIFLHCITEIKQVAREHILYTSTLRVLYVKHKKFLSFISK